MAKRFISALIYPIPLRFAAQDGPPFFSRVAGEDKELRPELLDQVGQALLLFSGRLDRWRRGAAGWRGFLAEGA